MAPLLVIIIITIIGLGLALMLSAWVCRRFGSGDNPGDPPSISRG